MVIEQPGLELHAMLKACYFVDKDHLNREDQPIFGATYRAMKYGPVPLEIYEMAKNEPLWLAETGMRSFPWQLDGYALQAISNDAPDMSHLSISDAASLRTGFTHARSMTFNERTAATHGPDWQKAKLGFMRYEDMLDDGPDKPARIEYLEQTGPFMRL
jgi:hypothetical protein